MLSVAHSQSSNALDSNWSSFDSRSKSSVKSKVARIESEKTWKETESKHIKEINFLSKAWSCEKSPSFAVTRFFLSQSLNDNSKPILTPRQQFDVKLTIYYSAFPRPDKDYFRKILVLCSQRHHKVSFQELLFWSSAYFLSNETTREEKQRVKKSRQNIFWCWPFM